MGQPFPGSPADRRHQILTVKRAERIRLIETVADILSDEGDWGQADFLLRQFGCPTRDRSGSLRDYLLEMLDAIDGPELVEFHEYLTGTPVEVAVDSSAGPWGSDYLRLFLSHLATHSVYVGQLKMALLDYGIDAFVAHDDIKVSKEWMDQIEVALATCDALAALLHPDFRQSSWTDQEVGYVLPRKVPIIPLMMGEHPYGFMSRWQGARCEGSSAPEVAKIIYDTLLGHPTTHAKLEKAVLASLRDSESFAEAKRRGQRLTIVSTWTKDRLDLLEAAWRNQQVSGAWNLSNRVKSLLKQHGRLEPPPHPDNVPF